MTLINEWKLILKHAWSVKFNIAAIIFGGMEVSVALIQPTGIPNGLFASIAMAVSIAAGVARLLAQKEITDGSK